VVQASRWTASPRARTARRHCRLRGPESLEHRRALAVTATAAIESFLMPIGSAAQPVVIRLADHFDGGGSPLTYSVTTDNGFAAATIDPAGLLTIKASSRVQQGFTTVSDNVVVRAASTTNASDFREATFTVYQKTPTRFANAMVAVSGTDARLTQTEVEIGSGWSWLLSPRVVTRPSAVVATHIGDFDGDFGDDLASIDAAGGVWVTRKLGVDPAATPELWSRLPSDARWESVTVRDFTGDGRLDIAARNAHNGNWRLLESEGVRFSDPQRFGSWSTSVAWQHIVAGDFDGNGSADLAARDPASGEWWVSRSTDIGFVTTRFAARSAPWSECFVGDFNADGRSDLAGRNPLTGRWRVFTSEGDRFAAGRVFGTWTPDVAWADATIGDVDGDGRSDLLGRNPTTGEWFVSRSTGTAFTTSAFGGFANPQNWGSFVAGDFTFDGKTDIAGRNQLTGTWRLLQGDGTRFDRPRRIGNWPTTTTSPTVLPLRVPFISRTIPSGGGSLSGGSLAVLPTWTMPTQGTSTSVPSTPNQGIIQITHDPATTNGGSWVSNVPTSGTSIRLNGSDTTTPFGTAVFGVGTLDREFSLTGSGVIPGGILSGIGSLGTPRGATFGPKGFYYWDLQASRVDGTPGTDWDLFHVREALQITATTAEPFQVFITGVGTQNTNFLASRDYAWKIAEADGGISGFAPEKFLISAQTNLFGSGRLSIVQNGNALELHYTA
jgi:hypothetical protein